MKSVIAVLLALSLFTGCGSKEAPEESIQWFPTQDEAIDAGLLKEGVGRTALLNIQSVSTETLVFYENYESLGVASIVEGPDGFRWHRNNPYMGLRAEGASPPYLSTEFIIQTYSGKKLRLLVGKVFDRSVPRVLVKSDKVEKELPILGNAMLFFTWQEPGRTYEIYLP